LRITRATSAALAASLLLALALDLTPGCGPSGAKLAPVAGKVTLNGEPLEGATVTFTPDPGNPEVTPGGASSGPGGAYRARYGERPGLAPGKYKVLVVKSALKGGASVPPEFKDDPVMAQISGLTVDALPPEYGNANTTPIAVDVPDGGGTFDLDVKQAKKKAAGK
jgi:hypothetical protein